MKSLCLIKLLCLVTMVASMTINNPGAPVENDVSLAEESNNPLNPLNELADVGCNSPCNTDSDCTGICEVCRMGKYQMICTKLLKD